MTCSGKIARYGTCITRPDNVQPYGLHAHSLFLAVAVNVPLQTAQEKEAEKKVELVRYVYGCARNET